MAIFFKNDHFADHKPVIGQFPAMTSVINFENHQFTPDSARGIPKSYNEACAETEVPLVFFSLFAGQCCYVTRGHAYARFNYSNVRFFPSFLREELVFYAVIIATMSKQW